MPTEERELLLAQLQRWGQAADGAPHTWARTCVERVEEQMRTVLGWDDQPRAPPAARAVGGAETNTDSAEAVAAWNHTSHVLRDEWRRSVRARDRKAWLDGYYCMRALLCLLLSTVILTVRRMSALFLCVVRAAPELPSLVGFDVCGSPKVKSVGAASNPICHYGLRWFGYAPIPQPSKQSPGSTVPAPMRDVIIRAVSGLVLVGSVCYIAYEIWSRATRFVYLGFAALSFFACFSGGSTLHHTYPTPPPPPKPTCDAIPDILGG
jgi:hypothetical protein